MDITISETKTKEELEKLCQRITSVHQNEFDLIIEEEKVEYDAFTRFVNLSERLENNLALAVNKFNPMYNSLLEIKYFRLTQFSIALEYRTKFHKRNSNILREKYSDKPSE